MKKLLCIVSRPPYQDSHSLELVETAMVGAVFDFSVSLLFRGDGVWSLLKDQDAGALSQRTLSNVLKALPTYDVDTIFVCEQAMHDRHLSLDDLALTASPLDFETQAALIAEQDAVMGAQA